MKLSISDLKTKTSHQLANKNKVDKPVKSRKQNNSKRTKKRK